MPGDTQAALAGVDLARSQAPHRTKPSVSPLHGSTERVKVRFRMLRRLPENHDKSGASAPCPKSIDAAIAFVDRIQGSFPPSCATLDDDGSAVIEFEDRTTGLFADIMFQKGGKIECYRRLPHKQSELVEGKLDSDLIRNFLSDELGIIIEY